ncbi:MAG TPA: hypothetical protein VEB22_06505 [Phycisphaerales bacterium]|nr:hypothetical protein [Phycisphaerales bacterium]
MLRSIAAVILSYIAMAALIMITFAALWIGLSPDRLLVPGEWKGNWILCIAAPGLTLLAGLFGGWMCAKIGRGPGPVKFLAATVLVLGLTMAFFTLQKPEPTGPRAPGLTMQQVMKDGREPTWAAISNPIIGAAAVLIGGLFLGNGRGQRNAPAQPRP